MRAFSGILSRPQPLQAIRNPQALRLSCGPSLCSQQLLPQQRAACSRSGILRSDWQRITSCTCQCTAALASGASITSRQTVWSGAANCLQSQSVCSSTAVRAVAQEEQPPATTAAEDDFLAASSVTFHSLGLCPELVAALHAAGFGRPAKVQGMLIPKALEGRNVVLAAETGSGKTLAYLLPIIDQLLAGRRQSNGGPRPANWVDDGAVVLCPNAALCEQVVAAANALTGPDGEPLAKALYVSSRNPPPKWSPDILVATPAGLMGMTQEYGGYYGWEWTKTGVVTRMRIVVADEADLLMEGSYARDLQRILAAFKEGDRNHGVLSVCRLLGMEEQQFLELPRHMRKAAQEGGLAAMVNAGFVPPRPLDVEGWDTQPVASTSETLPPRDWKRQYIFVAATMPSGAGKSVKADLQRLMPDAVWLNSMRLHYAQRGLTHHWVAATEDMWRETLQDVVAEDTMLRQGKGRMLVFASNVAAAINVAEALQEVGVRALLYHREVPVAERAAALETMSAREGVVLVCTDAAARGIDIAKVTHVVQADFASSAIDFLHRVGRTARAGRDGHVTSIYGPENEPLVDAIREAILAGEPVEGAFSRNRSFRKKYRRYGKFVPRGATAGQQ